LIAPADVPEMMPKGCTLARGRSLAIARNAPTWYAARAAAAG
jgi:hypothetical protein